VNAPSRGPHRRRTYCPPARSLLLQAAAVTELDTYVTTRYHSGHWGGNDGLTQTPAKPIDIVERGERLR